MDEVSYLERKRRFARLSEEAHQRGISRRAGLPEDARGWDALKSAYPPHVGNAAAFQIGDLFLAALREGRVPRCGLGYWGKQGSGKTTLLQSLAREAAGIGFHVRYVNLPEFQDEVFDREKDGWIQPALLALESPTILVVDEFAQEVPFPTWVDRFLAPLVNVRYSRGLPTLYGSTFDLDALPDRWQGLERAASIHSRLIERNATWVEVRTPPDLDSYRLPQRDF